MNDKNFSSDKVFITIYSPNKGIHQHRFRLISNYSSSRNDVRSNQSNRTEKIENKEYRSHKLPTKPNPKITSLKDNTVPFHYHKTMNNFKNHPQCFRILYQIMRY